MAYDCILPCANLPWVQLTLEEQDQAKRLLLALPLTFPEDFIPLNNAAPTIIQDRRRQRARYHTMLPVSSNPLERWRATLLKTQNAAMRRGWQQHTILPFSYFLKERSVLVSVDIARPCSSFRERAVRTAWLALKNLIFNCLFPLFLKSTSPQLSIHLPSGLPQLFHVNHEILMARKEPTRRISSQEPKEQEANWNHVAKEIAISQQAEIQNKVNIFCTVTPEKSVYYT